MRRRLGVLAILAVLLGPAVFVAPRAEAKMIPLEVQISERHRTVRVPPDEFIERINVPGAAGYFGVFEFEDGRPAVESTPMEVRLIVYADRSGSGTVHQTLGPHVVRETMVTLAYHRTSVGAVAQIRPPSTDTFAVGRWVRITPAFVRIVEEMLKTAPAVEPVDPPLRRRRWEARVDPYLRDLAVPAMSVAVAMGLLIVLAASRTSRRAAEREASALR